MPLLGKDSGTNQMKVNNSYAAGRLPTGVMNKEEEAYAKLLDELKMRGEVLWWKFEGITFKLAYRTTYTPDFNVMLANGQMQMHEYKGFWKDDARAKIKIAAAMFPFQFIAVTKEAKCRGGGYKREEF
jgi:hypothetical protein